MQNTMEKAQVTLPSDREVKVTRSFRAPRSLVYRAYTEPQLVQRWMLGPPGWSMPVCEMDVRVGGKYRWRWRSNADGSEFGFAGTFREVQPESRLVHTEMFDPGTIGEVHPQSEANSRKSTSMSTGESLTSSWRQAKETCIGHHCPNCGTDHHVSVEQVVRGDKTVAWCHCRACGHSWHPVVQEPQRES
jgi:uncharacterized protein YndB with AHSA1/START domain